MIHETDKETHTRANPCAVCGGYQTLKRGKGIRCYGFRVGLREYCTREEYEGRPSGSGLYYHWLGRNCDCPAMYHEGGASW